MAEIHIKVRNKVATVQSNEFIVCNNGDYTAVFDFEEDFLSKNFKTARFIWEGIHEDIVFDGNTCKIPRIESAEVALIGVFTDNPLETTPAIVKCKKGITSEISKPQPPTEDVYNQIIALLNEYIKTGNTVDLEAYQKKEDDELITDSKKIVVAINELETSKQDSLSFDGEYNSETNKVATVDSIERILEKIINGAPEDFDSFKEFYDWVLSHGKDVTAINTAINQNKADISLLNTKVSKTFISAEYNNSTKSLIFTLQNGDKVTVPIGLLINGLATTDFVKQETQKIVDEVTLLIDTLNNGGELNG